MTRLVTHDLAVHPTRDELAAQDFTSALRGHVLNHMAASLKSRFEAQIAPKLPAGASGRDVHAALKTDSYFRFYSALRLGAQEMVWSSVGDAVARESGTLAARAAALAADTTRAQGTLTLDPDLAVPRNVSAIDVHHMPGGYAAGDDIAAGAVYENGLSVFSFGLMGKNLDDIGESSAFWLTRSHPQFRPQSILDLGCSVGHQTLPWKRAYPDAVVTGIDVAAPCLRYANGRAQSQGVTAHFVQADATALLYPDASFDLVYSSMFLHELPLKDIHKVFAEARRVLKPGGLMLHYELPPNSQLSAYDGFYLDWDCWYNNEPFYKTYRDQDPVALCAQAGFPADGFFQTVVPSLGWYGETAVATALAGPATIGGNTGRLADGVQWFVYGNWA